MKKIIFLLILFLIETSLAEEYCHLLNDNSAVTRSQTSYVFGKKLLVCSKVKSSDGSSQSYLKSDLKLVKAHSSELSAYKIIASSHGYHLIAEQIDCSQDHCNHIVTFPLDEFQPVKKFDKNKSSHKVQTTIQTVVDLIDANLWLADIVTLSSWNRRSGSNDNNDAKTWIENKFNDLNLQTSTQAFTVSGSQTHNIIGVQAGTITPDNWYIVGAHMDSRPYSGNAPGAVDNASGCAGVLEIARIANQFDFASTILFICFSGEEQGLIGSYFHANSLINNGDDSKVKAVLIMDMIGYTNNSQHELLLETSLANQNLMDALAQYAATYAPNLTIFMSTNPYGSDHVPYLSNTNNMHGILSIDRDWSVYPAYHQNNDLPENINLTQGEYILKTNMAALADFAEIQGVSGLIFVNGFE